MTLTEKTVLLMIAAANLLSGFHYLGNENKIYSFVNFIFLLSVIFCFLLDYINKPKVAE